MNDSALLTRLIRLQADAVRFADELGALVAEVRGGGEPTAHTRPEEFRVESPDLFDRNNPPTKLTDEQKYGPCAQHSGDLITPKQLGMIKHLAYDAGVLWDEECQRVYRCNVIDLSKKYASLFIDHLKTLKKESVTA